MNARHYERGLSEGFLGFSGAMAGKLGLQKPVGATIRCRGGIEHRLILEEREGVSAAVSYCRNLPVEKLNLLRWRLLPTIPPKPFLLLRFLLPVGDAQGLSYYSDASLGRHLQMDPGQLAAARRQLEAAELIAYAKPLYQVLALLDPPGAPASPEAPRLGQAVAVGDILRRVLAGGCR